MKICFIERRDADTPSIERVFDTLIGEFRSRGIECERQKLPYGNRVIDIFRNLLFFKPEPADIYHIAGHINYIALRLPAERTIQTVHDLGILENRTGLRRWVVGRLFFRAPARRAKRTVAISEATRESLIRISGQSKDKIVVIPNPVPPGYTERSKQVADRPRILQIGTAPHKNLDRTAEALAGLDVHFRVIGKLTAAQRSLLEGFDLDFSSIDFVDDRAMLEEYEAADVVVFCSLFEGFGMPIIEAQAIGRPVVTSDRSPMKEVAGDGALLVDPESVSSIRQGIETFISKPDVAERYRRAGVKNAEAFQASTIADRYLELYQEIFAGR
jgi:glycosyltransferase involved in cell wall biosynthesis